MRFTVSTKGHYDFINITDRVAAEVSKTHVDDGVAVIFALHATVAITIMEGDAEVDKDIIDVWEKLAPEKADYKHHKRWGDHNGAAHIKSAFMKPSLSVPIEDSKLLLGTWQQIVLIDFDEKAREREIIVKVVSSN